MGLRKLWRSWFPSDFPKEARLPDFTPPGFQGRSAEDAEESRTPKTYVPSPGKPRKGMRDGNRQ